MDPRKPEIRGEMAGCKKTAMILACISGLFVAALLIVGYIEITGVQSFSDVPAAVQPSAVR